MPRPIRKACTYVELWLRGEDRVRPHSEVLAIVANPRPILDGIMKTSLAARWEEFRNGRLAAQEADTTQSYLEAAHRILAVTALARTAAVCRGTLLGTDPYTANAATLGTIHDELRKFADRPSLLPEPERLGRPLPEAIAPYSTTPIEGQYQTTSILTTMAGLAVDYLVEQHAETGEMALPFPGSRNQQQITPWVH